MVLASFGLLILVAYNWVQKSLDGLPVTLFPHSPGKLFRVKIAKTYTCWSDQILFIMGIFFFFIMHSLSLLHHFVVVCPQSLTLNWENIWFCKSKTSGMLANVFLNTCLCFLKQKFVWKFGMFSTWFLYFHIFLKNNFYL